MRVLTNIYVFILSKKNGLDLWTILREYLIKEDWNTNNIFFCINSLKSPTLLGYSWYNISKKTNKEVRNLDEKEMRDTVENIFGIELEDGDKEKTIGEEVREILNIKGE